MLGLLKRSRSAPVADLERRFIEEALLWFAEQFSWAPVAAPVVIPTTDFFPSEWSGTDGEVEDLLTRLCAMMRLDSGRVQLTVFEEDEDPATYLTQAYESQHSGPAGLFFDEEHEGRFIIAVAEWALDEPGSLVATLAHELAHVHLLGDKRLSSENESHERMTDLLTVFFGLGVFTANAAFQFSQWQDSGWQGWSTRRLGYLDESELGYSLAAYAWARNESDAQWSTHLVDGVRSYFRKALRYLEAGGDTSVQRGVGTRGA